jgi:arabinose-5-phosphate isomerase
LARIQKYLTKIFSPPDLRISDKKLLEIAGETLRIEAHSVLALPSRLNDQFIKAVRELYSCTGRVIVSGIGKSAIIAQKMVATFNSTGTPSVFLHAADAIHGDLGMITAHDLVICLSKSGESPEIKVLVPLVKGNGNRLIAVVGNTSSYLAQNANYVIDASVRQEACPNNLAPTSSTMAQLALGDALAVCLLKMRGFSPSDFAKFHPGGALGKKLYLKVNDLSKQHARPAVQENDPVSKVILEITSNRLGATAVLDARNRVKGIITDGDLRRMIERNPDYSSLRAKNIMGKKPKQIAADELAINALELMRASQVTQLVVMDKNKYLGMIHVHDLLKEGLV